MIKITNRILNETVLPQVLARLNHQVPLPAKTAYHVMKIYRFVDHALKEANDLYVKVVKAHALLDEKGNLKPDTYPAGHARAGQEIPGSFIVPDEKKESFEKEREAMLNIEVEFGWEKLQLAQLEGVKLTGGELEALEPVMIMTELKPVAKKQEVPNA